MGMRLVKDTLQLDWYEPVAEGPALGLLCGGGLGCLSFGPIGGGVGEHRFPVRCVPCAGPSLDGLGVLGVALAIPR